MEFDLENPRRTQGWHLTWALKDELGRAQRRAWGKLGAKWKQRLEVGESEGNMPFVAQSWYCFPSGP